jgi:hypothetical protein
MYQRYWRYVGMQMARLAATLVLWLPLASPTGAPGPDVAMPTALANQAPNMSGRAGTTTFPRKVAGTHYVYVNNGAIPNSITGYAATHSGLTPLSGSPYRRQWWRRWLRQPIGHLARPPVCLRH